MTKRSSRSKPEEPKEELSFNTDTQTPDDLDSLDVLPTEDAPAEPAPEPEPEPVVEESKKEPQPEAPKKEEPKAEVKKEEPKVDEKAVAAEKAKDFQMKNVGYKAGGRVQFRG